MKHDSEGAAYRAALAVSELCQFRMDDGAICGRNRKGDSMGCGMHPSEDAKWGGGPPADLCQATSPSKWHTVTVCFDAYKQSVLADKAMSREAALSLARAAFTTYNATVYVFNGKRLGRVVFELHPNGAERAAWSCS